MCFTMPYKNHFLNEWLQKTLHQKNTKGSVAQKVLCSGRRFSDYKSKIVLIRKIELSGSFGKQNGSYMALLRRIFCSTFLKRNFLFALPAPCTYCTWKCVWMGSWLVLLAFSISCMFILYLSIYVVFICFRSVLTNWHCILKWWQHTGFLPI